MTQLCKTVFFLAALTLFWARPADAHRVTIFAWVEDGMVHTESKFSGGRKPVGATVKVLAPGGEQLLEGKTDEKGAFSFKPPVKTELKVVLLAGAGHRAEWTLHADAFTGADGREGDSGTSQAHPDAGTPLKGIMGGLACILALTGMGMYWNYRRKKRDRS
jgi:hypothetical protein